MEGDVTMSWQPSLYFVSILITFAVMGFLALYAWRQRKLAGASAFRAYPKIVIR
jgi:NADH:ubiquinone oxidoreductase subunit H